MPDKKITNYVVQPLGDQDRAAFHCGDKDLDSYFLQRASRDVRENLSAVFVLLTEEDDRTVLGFYTLSPQEIEAENLPQELQKRTGRYKRIGATLLGRLAVAENQQGKNLGEFLLLDALKRSLQNTRNVSSFAVIVDAKGEHVVRFYKKYGFMHLSGNRLFLPMATIKQLFS
ncbi:MAG TPA: GNAT family N-acetyltransferase [Terriglobales bacterium]|nr:GNAT family N-acetyltransferase [Terriglobales bacterium]